MDGQFDLKSKFSYLLPRGFLPVGFVFTCLGIVLGVLRFYFGIKPDFFERHVYALYSYYLESKTLQVINNQLIEEITGLFLIIGLFLIAFTKEKYEHPHTNSIRLHAFFISIYLNTIFLIAAMIFTFGFAFVYMMMINMCLFMLIYIIIFRVLVLRSRVADKTVKQ